MGCGIAAEKLNYRNEVFVKEKQTYNKRQDNLLIATNEYIDDLIKKSQLSIEGVNYISLEIKNKGSVRMREGDLKKSVSEALMQENYMNYIENVDVMESITDKIINKNSFITSKYSKDDIDRILDTLFINYPSKQKKFTLNVKPKKEFKTQAMIQAFYTTLKYNMTYNVDMLVLEMDYDILNDKYHCTELGNIIACNKNLKSLIIKFICYDTPLDADEKYVFKTSNLNKVFSACEEHENLKCLVIINDFENGKVEFGNDIENNICNMIKQNKLNILLLHKIILSERTITNLSDAIAVSKSLKCLFINASKYCKQEFLSDPKYIDYLIDKGIKSNIIINCILISGFNLPQGKLNNYNALLKNMTRIIPFFEVIKNCPEIKI